MRILVTGYKGFIGQNMCEALKEHTEHTVTTYSWGDKFPWHMTFDLVIHLGAISSTAEMNADRVMLKNYQFTVDLLSWCNTKGTNVQYASSASVYGAGPDFRETAQLQPRSPYSWSKYLIDRHVSRNKWNIRVQGFRYFNVYGPHEEHKDQPSPFTAFRKQATETGIITLFKNSHKAKRDFVPVERVIELHKQFFNIEETGVWNIGSGEARSFTSIAEEIAADTGATIEEIPMPAHLKAGYQWFTEANLDKLDKTLALWK